MIYPVMLREQLSVELYSTDLLPLQLETSISCLKLTKAKLLTYFRHSKSIFIFHFTFVQATIIFYCTQREKRLDYCTMCLKNYQSQSEFKKFKPNFFFFFNFGQVLAVFKHFPTAI